MKWIEVSSSSWQTGQTASFQRSTKPYSSHSKTCDNQFPTFAMSFSERMKASHSLHVRPDTPNLTSRSVRSTFYGLYSVSDMLHRDCEILLTTLENLRLRVSDYGRHAATMLPWWIRKTIAEFAHNINTMFTYLWSSSTQQRVSIVFCVEFLPNILSPPSLHQISGNFAIWHMFVSNRKYPSTFTSVQATKTPFLANF